MKQLIWTSEDYFNDDARMGYQNLCRENYENGNYNVSDKEWAEVVSMELEDERSNLDINVDGVIVAFANLGLWNGRKQGYAILGNNISQILHSHYDAEWFGDTYNIRGIEWHHDGTNHILYRVAKDMETAQHIAEKIFCVEIDEKKFRKMTRSAYPYVASVYGWKMRNKAMA